MHHHMHVETRKQSVGVSSLLLLFMFLGWNSGHQPWSLTELSHWSLSVLFDTQVYLGLDSESASAGLKSQNNQIVAHPKVLTTLSLYRGRGGAA